MAVCRSCGAFIVWAVTSASGKRMPLDPASDDGNVILLGEKAYVFRDGPAAAAALADWSSTGTRHLSHFATCKHRDAWRRS